MPPTRATTDDGTAVLVRRYEPSDWDDLLAFYLEYPNRYRSLGTPPLDEAALRRWLRRMTDSGQNVLARIEGALVGHAVVYPADDPVPELAVYVDGSHHGRGIGTHLCESLLSVARAAGHEGVTLLVNRGNGAAIALYQKVGFETVDEGRFSLTMEISFDGDATDA